MWLAYDYRDAWSNLYVECDEDTKIMLDARLDQLKEKGNQTGRPISAPLQDGIFELRAKKARMLFYFGEVTVGKSKQRAIIFVHSLFKETRAIPRADIKLAKKRRNEILTMGGRINALPN